MSFVLIASFLPHLDAFLNATTLTWLLIGYARIRRGNIDGHRRAMLTAFGCSIAFLAVYLTHHALSGSRAFPKSVATPIRVFYYVILVSHVVLAAAVPVLAIVTIVLGLRDRREQHRKWAKWTFPIWLYVSVTGIVVYVMLYWLYSGLQTPSAGL